MVFCANHELDQETAFLSAPTMPQACSLLFCFFYHYSAEPVFHQGESGLFKVSQARHPQVETLTTKDKIVLPFLAHLLYLEKVKSAHTTEIRSKEGAG